MIEAALCFGFIWLVWKLVMRDLGRAERDCEIARLMVINRIVEQQKRMGDERHG